MIKQEDLYRYIYEMSEIKIKIGEEELKNYEIKELKIEFESNKHQRLHLVFENLENQNRYLALKNDKDIKIIISGEKDGKVRNLFVGYVDNFNIGYYGAKGYRIRIEGISNSIILDRDKKFRVYQDRNKLLGTIIKDVLKEYKIIFKIDNELENITSGKPIVQYNESDWEFIIRLASQIGLGVYSTSTGSLNIGNVGETQKKEIAVQDNLWELSKNKFNEVEYILHSNYSLLCGDEVKLYLDNNKTVDVICKKGYLELANGVTKGYVKMIQSNYKYKYIPNINIAGKVILGKVEKVVSENGIAKMKVDMTIGLNELGKLNYGKKYLKKIAKKDESIEKYSYPYVTPYSQSNTGLFCTPEKNDIVAIYYPCDEEEKGYVMGSVNNINSARFNNPEIRNYTLPIPLENGEREEPYFNFRVNSSIINIFAEELIKLSTKEKIEAISEHYIDIKSKELSSHSKDLLKVFSKNVDKRYSKEESIIVERKLRVDSSKEKINEQSKNVLKVLLNKD